MRQRQIHLDFHTSEAIPHIAANFNAEDFADTLKKAHVDSITCFSRCHHGWLYYPSKKFPDRIHPNLEYKDLLGDQIRACKNLDINVPVYLPLQWDHLTSNEHPEWLVLDENGRQVGSSPFEAGFYRQICLNTPYRDMVLAQAVEVLEMYPDCDGLFLDIINSRECSCVNCRQGMIEKKMDPASSQERQKYMRHVIREFTEYISSEVRKVRADAGIYYNHSHVRLSHRDIIQGFTHLELESLPGGGWGYWDFPITIRYARTLGVPCIGQTGKFHTSWGDFNSLKTLPALEYECFRSLAFTAACSIGDQLDPLGTLSDSTYKLISTVYEQVKKKEPWCKNVRPVVEMAVLSPDRFEGTVNGSLSPDISGCTRMLQELGYQFNIIDEQEDFSKYRILILPDHVAVNDTETAEKLTDFMEKGGSILSSYMSGRNTQTGDYENFKMGFSKKGPSPFCPDFIVPENDLLKDLEPVDYVMYKKAECVEPEQGTDVISWVNRPYFNRSWEHFCSHQHSPSSYERAYPGVLRNKNLIHFIHPIFTTYHELDPLWCKTLIKNAIDMLMPDQLVKHNGPSSLIVTVNKSESRDSYIVHLLHYIPERRGQKFDSIQDVIPLNNIKLSLCIPESYQRVCIVPQDIGIKPERLDDYLVFSIPEIQGHQMVEISLKE
ncbi:MULTISPECIES: beta-galactosidase trimerization domain-containing protein [unclassified Oceanispirochaeta]|uniref:beta-galactosidase trimerization domain-containing protein n=1 Tax=unclassified Oceanispirochaeta TaxID=2635722 RepID=UPI001314B472|nr:MULTISPECIES: beta-galactosidase trimerization domain-containing protein [unclassified Oceanispirochaeta]MBF9017609.1 beta-galactosidase trimerization domain-containing protein [Oceanispirochaeta sp. M2]NPD74181.1 beta-galactosidase [Oceanispirochaeta sp. M1]